MCLISSSQTANAVMWPSGNKPMWRFIKMDNLKWKLANEDKIASKTENAVMLEVKLKSDVCGSLQAGALSNMNEGSS